MADNDSDEEAGLLSRKADSQLPRRSSTTKARQGESFANSCIRVARKVVTQKSSVAHTAIVVFFISGLLGVVLWDLQQVHRISTIIHDDHSSLWEYVNDTTLKQWLTPLDLCLLKATDPTVDLKKFRASNCSNVKSYISESSPQRLFCSIGSSMGRQCPSPLSQHSFFQQRLRDFKDPHARYLSKALRTLARKQIPLIFIGDGLSKQNEDAVVCDMLRTDRVSVAAAVNLDYHDIVSDYSIRWKDEALRLDIKYFPLSFIDNDDDGDGDESVLLSMVRRHKRKRRRAFSITASNHSTSALPGKASSPRSGKGSTSVSKKPAKQPEAGSNITFFEGASPMRSAGGQLIDYRLKSSDAHEASANTSSTASSDPWSKTHGLQVIQQVVEAVLAKNHSVAIIANAGLWYNSRERFRKELPVLLGWLDSLASDPRNIVLYRETAAQHWNHTSYGYYDSDYQHGEDSTGTCVPIADSSPGMSFLHSLPLL